MFQLRGLNDDTSQPIEVVLSTPLVPRWYQLLAMASAGVSAYHGYKRNDSIGWAIGWGFLGGLFPVIVPAIAFGQGLGKRKAK